MITKDLSNLLTSELIKLTKNFIQEKVYEDASPQEMLEILFNSFLSGIEVACYGIATQLETKQKDDLLKFLISLNDLIANSNIFKIDVGK